MTHALMMFFDADTATGGAPSGPSIQTDGTPASEGSHSVQETIADGGLAGADGTFVEGWTARLPEDLGDYRNGLTKFKTVADFARSYQGLEQKLGSKATMVSIPTEKSSPEEVATYRRALGIPDNPAEYQVEPPALPEGATVDDRALAQFSQLAHRLNIPPDAAKALLQFDLERGRARAAVVEQMTQEHLAAGRAVLTKTFGEKYDEQINLAVRAAKTVGVDVQSPGFTDPQVVIAFARLAQKMGDDQFVTGSSASAGQLTGPARAKDIQSNKQNPQHQRYREGDPDTVALVRSLLQQG